MSPTVLPPPPVSSLDVSYSSFGYDLTRGLNIEESVYATHKERRARQRRWADSNPIKPNHKVRASTLKRRIDKAAEIFGENRLGFLTLTFKKGTSLEEATKAFRRATPCLKEEFPDGWVRVTSFSKSGQVHFHLTVIAPFDLKEDFNQEAYVQLQKLQKNTSRSCEEWGRMRQLSRSLTTNPHLKALWKKLRKNLCARGFGRSELTPFRKSPEVVGRYMVRNLYNSIRSKHRPKGARLISYVGNFPDVPELPKTKSQLRFAMRKECILQEMGMTRETMRETYGRGWHYKLMGAMDEIGEFPVDPQSQGWGYVAREIERLLKPPFSIWDSNSSNRSSVLDDLEAARTREMNIDYAWMEDARRIYGHNFDGGASSPSH